MDGGEIKLILRVYLVLGVTLLSFCDQEPRFTSPHPYEHGMNLPSWRIDGYEADELDESLADLADCGGDWVALVPTWYQEGVNSTDIHRTQRTVSDSSLIRAIRIARRYEFHLMLKPHLDVETGEWRGKIKPSDIDAWFESYREMILHYADICEEYGIERLCVGTELNSLSREPQWRELIESIRSRYPGELTYAANWDAINSVEFWDVLDFAGIDFFAPLASRDNDDVEVYLTNLCEWFNRLDGFADKVGIPIIITEIGFRSIADTPQRPWDWRSEGVMSEAEQAECYRVVLEVFPRKQWLAGIYFWFWSSDPENISPSGYSPQGKEAQELLKEFWR